MRRRRLRRPCTLGVLPIFVGGTGLYFKALTRGLSAVPPIPADIRAGVRARLEAEGPRRCTANWPRAIRPRQRGSIPPIAPASRGRWK